MKGHPVEVVLPLEDLGLVHAPGSTCDQEKCKADGGHRAVVRADLGANGLHAYGDCDDWPETESAERDRSPLQEAHQQMHPRGTVYIESCYEPVCRRLLGAA
jgi:hypothetical protein